MPRYAAFLRAINVGRRRVTMDHLARHLAEAGARDVRTVLSSGNAVFTDRRGERTLQDALARHLASALGFDVPVLLRTAPQVTDVLDGVPFGKADVARAHALLVGFGSTPMDRATASRLAALSGETDDVRAVGRDVFWLRRTREPASDLVNGVFDRTAGQPLTFRTLDTVRKVHALLTTA